MNNVEFSALSLEELFSINGGSSQAIEFSRKMAEEEKKIAKQVSQSPQQSGRGVAYSQAVGRAEKTVSQKITAGKKKKPK
ncbi:MAG: hypothetical protein II796_00695 [Oscillospiraceae bacterium]|nr:hypothetical protein [Oscillospiraceae bacterium]